MNFAARPDRLSGLAVLVIEDDYLLADDTCKALEGAGATVLGPYRNAAQASARADGGRPNCAVLDLNLGGGADFTPARDFMAKGVPIVIVTGYDSSVIPDELSEAPCLQKPTQPAWIVAAVAKACDR